ncbi:hypothetical protein FRC02_011114 [Tulasnella sp. 418]|nr:hypothetical protein FRC02_011114 [Tulasnella sp. 418]
MPECPDILTEPQYAALAFTTVCQECGGTKGLRVYFALYSRYCARCVDDHILSINSGEIMSSQNSQLLRFVGWDCFIAMFPSTYARGSGRSRRLYRWTSKKVLDSLAEEWSNLKTAQEKDAFIESRKFIVDNLQKHTSALLSWQDEQEKRKSMTASVNKMARFDSIKERLLSMGWEERYLPEYTGFGNSAASREWFRLVQKNQVLTERVWQNLYPKLVPILESLKADGMIKEREERARARVFRLMSYYQQLRETQARQGTHILFPQSHHWGPDKIICKITPIKKLIDDDGEQVTPERWNEIVPEVLDFLKSHTDLLARNILAWYSDSLKEFYGKPSISPQLRAVIAQHISAGSNLNLSNPTVVFQCETCHVPLWYPGLFLHHHCIPPDKWPDTTTWTSGMPPPLGLTFNLAMISTISQILGCLGIDLDSTTSVDLPAPLPNPYLSTNSSDEYYCCNMCNALAATPMTMPALSSSGFSDMVDHVRAKHGIDVVQEFVAIATIGVMVYSHQSNVIP